MTTKTAATEKFCRRCSAKAEGMYMVRHLTAARATRMGLCKACAEEAKTYHEVRAQ